MHGLLIIALLILGIMFVMAPLGVFVWFGLSADYLLFEEGYWPTSLVLLALYYAGNFLLLLKLPKMEKKWIIGVTIFGIWLFGLFGFLEVVEEVNARFKR